MNLSKTIIAMFFALAMTFAPAGAALAADGDTIIVTVKSVEQIEAADADYTDSDVAELARIVYWEARGESQEGQLAVANVVMNRVNSPDFPDTIKGVISQENQFSPYERSDYYKVSVPDEYYTIAEMALAGDSVLGDGVCWFRSDSKPKKWYKAVYTLSIGNHHFYGI